MGGIGTMELLIILAVGVLLFGSRLPEIAKSVGKGVYEFKKGLSDMGGNEIKEILNIEDSIPTPAQKKEDIVETTTQKFEPPAEESTTQETVAQEPTTDEMKTT